MRVILTVLVMKVHYRLEKNFIVPMAAWYRGAWVTKKSNDALTGLVGR
ncbi:hypothetical protein M3226_14685 [Neobacillus cucumis]|nr:hypothetical protein [Neobacillus cucumis]MCM3726931.1 hypothetical protein [Neobacillus cucumis]